MAIMHERIKELRSKRGYTLSYIADCLDVTEATAQRYETGKGIKTIPYDVIEKYANIFNCTPSYIMGWEQEEIAAVSETQNEANTYEDHLEADFKSLYEEFGELHFTHSDIEKVQKIMRNIQRRNSCDVILELELTDEEIDEVYKYAKYLISIRK